MKFEGLLIIVVLALGLQIFIFVWGRRIRKREKSQNVLLKYNIKSRGDAWKLMADMKIPEKDRNEIKAWYDKDGDQE